jgi:ABC-type nitrate/sulfonate/bicarbonate transport system permease component
MQLIRPFEETTRLTKRLIIGAWLLILGGFWALSAMGTTHLFPTPSQVLDGVVDLWKAGLAVHIVSSIWLCAKAVFISIIISLIICYASPLPALKPIGTFLSKLRYLPLTGISFYISILVQGARTIQVWVLVVFMSTFLITSLMSMIKDIPDEEFDHAKSLGCNRWEILWEVVIKGRFDYVIELVRQNLAIVWMMLVTVESILVAAGGIGFLIKNNDKLGDSGKVIALQIIIVLLGIGLDYLLTWIRKISFRYSNF